MIAQARGTLRLASRGDDQEWRAGLAYKYTAVAPTQALEFTTPLVTYAKAAGVIGTEITIFEQLATVFAEDCLGRFVTGEPIGKAVRNARLKLLKEGNPLGLVYIPFGMSGLRMVDKT